MGCSSGSDVSIVLVLKEHVPELTNMASQLREDGSFLDKPRNRSSVPTVCCRTISYLKTEM